MNYGMMDDETMIQEVLFTGIVHCAPTTDQPTHHTHHPSNFQSGFPNFFEFFELQY